MKSKKEKVTKLALIAFLATKEANTLANSCIFTHPADRVSSFRPVDKHNVINYFVINLLCYSRMETMQHKGFYLTLNYFYSW